MIDLQPIAEKIVYDLQAATGQEVELIDRYGRSVASSSPRLHYQLEKWTGSGEHCRNGAVVEGSEKSSAVHIQELLVQEEVVGYLALGGDLAVLETLSRTARWIAQTLIEEYGGHPEQITPEALHRTYFEDILFSEQSSQLICVKAATANIDPETCCYIAVLRLWYDVMGELDLQEYREILGQLTELLEQFCKRNPAAVLLNTLDKRILISDNIGLMRISIIQFSELVEKRSGGRFRVYAGISNRSVGHYNLRACYENAAVICDRLTGEGQRILAQDECRLELLMERVSMETKRDFVAQVFGDCPEEDVDEWSRIISVLSKNNGSINRSATELFMHKNTLQYRLMRIKERIGLDPRVSQDALVLQIAFIARNSIKSERYRHLELETT